MGTRRVNIHVEGMSCASCERRIEGSLSGVEGIASVKADSRSGKVAVEFDGAKISLDSIKNLIAHTGYPVGLGGSAASFIALGVGAVLVGLYMWASSSGLFNALPAIDATVGYGMLFIAGLLTSVHCVAMCGGIALSQSVAKLGGPQAKGNGAKLEKLVPGLLYNGGRVVSYTVVGGIVGALGSVFDFSPLVKALIAALAGVFMLFMGLRMMGLLTWLPSFRKASIGASGTFFGRLNASLRGRGPFAVGLLNGLMPCGPLQTMQLYALGTGSALAGALSMFLFSLGTVPLLLGFGIVAAILPRKVVPVMLKASAVLVLFLGVLTLSRAASFAGVPLPFAQLPKASSGAAELAESSISQDIPVVQVDASSGTEPKAVIEKGVQTVRTVFGANNYASFVAQAGVPLKWIITIAAGDLNGCNNTMIVPAYGIKKKLVAGENVVEFTPKKEGIIAYSCWMGMIKSKITVVTKLADAPVSPQAFNAQATQPGDTQNPGDQGETLSSCCGG